MRSRSPINPCWSRKEGSMAQQEATPSGAQPRAVPTTTYAQYPYAILTEALGIIGSALVPAPTLELRRAHSGAPATDAVLLNDVVGEVDFLGYDGTGLALGGAL